VIVTTEEQNRLYSLPCSEDRRFGVPRTGARVRVNQLVMGDNATADHRALSVRGQHRWLDPRTELA